jgi:tetratricopeptide (TPR) repeat protein
VFNPFAKVVLGIVAAAACCSTTVWAAPQQPASQQQGGASAFGDYKDQGEVDIATAAGKETDPQKKLDKIKEWEQKYPDSKLKNTRSFMEAQGLLPIALAAYGKTGPAEVIDAGQKAAQQLVDNLDKYLSEDVRAAVKASPEQWKQAHSQIELQAHSVLGWTNMTKHQDPQAETEFKKILQLDPNQAQISFWLGSVIIRQKNVERYSEALYDIARSLSVTTGAPLAPAAKTQATGYLQKAFEGYHGGTDGLDQLKAAVASSALPPPGFHIDSITEIQNKQFASQDLFNKAHPDVAQWRLIRDTLKGDGGDAYFQNTLKGSEVPSPEIGTFKAKIVTVEAKDIVVNVDNAGGDATLKFDKAINQKAINVGDAMEFKGEVESFTKEPYMLSLTIDDPKEAIKGLPATAFSAAPPTRRPGAKKTLPKKTTK